MASLIASGFINLNIMWLFKLSPKKKIKRLTQMRSLIDCELCDYMCAAYGHITGNYWGLFKRIPEILKYKPTDVLDKHDSWFWSEYKNVNKHE